MRITRDRLLRWISYILLGSGFTMLVVRTSKTHSKLAKIPTFDDCLYFVDALERIEIFRASGAGAFARSWVDLPPHSPYSCLVAIASYLALGFEAWTPYLGNAAIVVGLLAAVDHFARNTPLPIRVAFAVLVLSLPMSFRAVDQFRPDIACGLVSALGVVQLVRPLDQLTRRQRIIAGATFGLALMVKTPAAPLTLGLAFVGILVSLARDCFLFDRRPLRRYFICCLDCVWPMLFISAPYYLVAGAATYRYIVYALFTYAKANAYQSELGGFWFQCRYYLDGVGGQFTLGAGGIFIVAGVLVAAFACMRFRRARNEIISLCSLLAVGFAAYAVPTISDHKQPFMCVTFHFILLFAATIGMSFVVRSIPRVSIAAVICALVAVAPLTPSRWVNAVAAVETASGATNQSAQINFIHEVLACSKKKKVGVYMPMVGQVLNEGVMNLESKLRRDDTASFRGDPYRKTIAEYVENIQNADLAILNLSDESTLVSQLPSTQLAPEIRAAIAAEAKGPILFGAHLEIVPLQPILRDPCEVSTGNEEQRFDDLIARGLGGIEGPYPEWSLPRVRWGLAPATILGFVWSTSSNGIIHARARSPLDDERVRVVVDGREVATWSILPEFRELETLVPLTPGVHQVTFEYSKFSAGDTDRRKMAVLYTDLGVREAPN